MVEYVGGCIGNYHTKRNTVIGRQIVPIILGGKGTIWVFKDKPSRIIHAYDVIDSTGRGYLDDVDVRW